MSFMENFEKELNGMRASEGKSAVKVSSGSKSSSKSTTKKKKKSGFMDNFYDELSSIADDDIGPVYDRARNRMTVKGDGEEDDSKLDFFQKGLFEDGYQAGDITKTILGTAGDAALGVVKGVGSLVEGVADLGQYGVAGVADLLGKEDVAEEWKKSAKWNLVDSVTKDATDYLDKYSVLGRTSEAILQGVGQVGGIVATGALGAAAGLGTAGTTALTTGVMGLSSMGSGMGEAYQSGATDEDAVTYGLISGAADALTEMMFGGLGKAVNAVGLSKGLLSADDMLAKAVSKKFSNQIAKNFAEFGVKASAEGLEEVVAGVAQAMGKKFTYMSEKDFKDILEDENLLEQFIVGSATSGMIQSGIIPGTKKGSLIEANKNESDFLTGTTKNEQAVIQKEVENRVAAEEQSGKKLTKKEKAAIEEQVVRDLEKGYISTDTIEEVLGGSTYDIYKGTADSEDAILREYEELGKKTNATLAEQSRYAELTQQVKDIREKSQRDALKTQLGEEVAELVKGDRLAESYNERARRGQAFQADLTKYDAKQQAVIQKAIDSGILNNTNRTHEFVDMVAKISADKGVLFDFTNNQKLKDSGFAVEGRQVNGYVTKDGITLNIDSKKALESTVGHEITHVLEGTEVYDALKQTIFDYAKAKGEYQGRYDSLVELYKDVKDADIEKELTADLVGDYLFSDTDFISNLSTQNRNVFQKIYDEIKYLCKIATAGSKEARELERVRKAFDDAYRAGGKAQSDTKYSLSVNFPNDAEDVAKEYFGTTKKWSETGWLLRDGTQLDFSGRHWERDPENEIELGESYYSGKRNMEHYEIAEAFPNLREFSSMEYRGEHLDRFQNRGNIRIVGKGIVAIEKMPTEEQFEKLRSYFQENIDKYIVVGIGRGGLNFNEGTSPSIIIEGIRDYFSHNRRNQSDLMRFHTKYSLSDSIEEYSDMVDSDGEVLTVAQKNYFEKNGLKDDNGNLIKLYRSADGGRTVWDGRGAESKAQGIYLTDDVYVARAFASDGRKVGDVLEVYANAQNPLIIDAEGSNYMDIPMPENAPEWLEDSGDWEGRLNADQLPVDAFANGHDAVIIKNVREGVGGGPATDVILRDSNQMKRTDNKNPSADPDIRYSLSSEGLSEADKQDALKVVKNLNTRAMASRYTSNFATYTPERMDREIERSSSATVMDYAKSYITWVDPFDFIYATTTSDRGREQLREEAGALDIEKLRGETQPIHLTVDFETGRIVGHEGRHRMLALQAEDVRHVAVIIDAWNDNRSQTKPISMMKLQGQEFSQYERGDGFYLHDLLPLSKRYADTAKSLFTSKSRYGGVQFSLSDSDGRQLTAEQQEYFKDSKVRDENGNLLTVYHGSKTGGFNTFRYSKDVQTGDDYGEAYYFTSDRQKASGYSYDVTKDERVAQYHKDRDALMKRFLETRSEEDKNAFLNYKLDGKDIYELMDDEDYLTEGGEVKEVYLNLKNPLIADAGGKYYYEVYQEYFDQARANGNDGIIVKNVIDNPRGEARPIDTYIAFSPEQIKNIDNATPTDNPDIRFSLSKPVEETKDLIAVHNLHASELAETLKLSGLPSPSVAIIKAKDGHEKYGDVSLILPKNAIDPQVNKANRIYGSDAWTPTRSNAQVEYEVNYDTQRKFEREVEQLSKNVANGIFSRSSVLGMAGIEGSTDKNLKDIAEKISDYDSVRAAYIAENGGNVDVVYREKVFDSYGNDALKGYVDKVGVQEVARLSAKMLTGERLTETELEMAKDAMTDSWIAKHEYALKQKPALRETRIAKFRERLTDLRVEDFVRHAWEFYENTGASSDEVDYGATGNNLRSASDRAEVAEWVEQKLQGLLGEPAIYNGKDPFTSSGKRRSFKEMHWEYTAENIVKAMNNADARGANVWNVSGEAIIATATPEYKTIDEVRAEKDRLFQTEDYEQIKDEVSKKLQQVTTDIVRHTEHHSDNQYDEEQIIGRVIMEAAQGQKTVSGVKQVFRKNGYNIGEAQAKSVLALFDHASKVPTGYFEAKPQRVVGFDEVGVYVIPYDADVKLKQELLNRGYSIAEYDPKVEGDRQRVVNQFEEYKFSLSNVGEAPVRPNYRVTMGEDIVLKGIAPVAENTTVQQETQLTEDKSTLSETETVDEAPLPDSGEEVKQTRKQYHQSIIDRIRGTFKTKGFDFDNVLKNAKNLSTWSTVDNTPQRVMEKALGYKAGGVLADITVNKVAQNESEGIKWVNRNVATLKQISRQYHIKPGSKESAAAQMYAEGFYVNKNNEIVRYGDPELIQDFKNPEVRRNIKGLARDPRIRKIYDDTLASINESRTRNLYPEIPRLDNYFLHFRAMTDTFSTLGLPFNPNDIRAKDLPTDLNGVTADLKPGQPYFASAMHREGKRTSFDLLGGVERYLNSAKNQIYHIDDIQTLRALRNHIAETYGQATGLEDIDSLSDAEAEERIKQVYGAHLSTFAKFLNEEANVLAGKTALIDRGLEGIIGRRGITFLNTLNQQVGSNMVGYNVSSSLTNFLPVAQTFAKTNKFDFVKAFAQTAANKVSGGRLDSFTEDSPVVIRRKGQDRFYQTPWQKMQNPGYALMGMVDDISTELIARTKYNELTRKGMDSQKAHFETDKWVSRLMGDRSLGQMPQLYNSKMLGLITKFQLEVRNQLDAQFYDTVQEKKVSNEHIRNGLARNAKTAAQVASTFAQLAVVQHLFGMAFESVAGYNPAFDIIEVLMTAFGYDDEEDSEDTALDNFAQGLLALAEDMPYASTFTGGRVPISEAIPDVNAILRGEDEYGNEIGIPQALVENAKEIAPYYLMPAGFGQMKKTKAGLDMFSDEHPIAGSYTDAGNLRFPVEDTLKNRIHAGIFGQYANENARKYFDQEQRTLNPDQTAIFAELDMPIEDYWEYRDNLYAFYDAKDQLEEAAEADGATDEDVLKSRYAKSVYSDINKLYSQQKEIAGGNSLLKQEQLRDIQSQMEKMLSESKSAVDNISVSGAYAEVGDRRYNYDAEEDTWYEIKPKNADGSDNYYYQQEQEITKKFGISYSEYWNNRDEYSFAYSHPKEYALAKAIGGYDVYADHYDALENWKSDSYIASDKDKYGDSISGSRKKKVQAYIDGLDISDIDKILLFKSVYTSYDDYNSEIIDYLNSRKDLSYEEKEFILVKLGAKVDSEGYIEW